MPRIQISEPGKTPQPYRVKLDREIIKIGRASNNDIILTDGSTSTYHCEVERVDGGYVLIDNSSTNGVYLDDIRFLRIDLNQETEFYLGDVKVDFSFTDEEYEVLADEDDFVSKQAPHPKGNSRSEARGNSAKEAENLEDTKKVKHKSSSSRASLMLESDELEKKAIEKKAKISVHEEEPKAKSEDESKPTSSRAARVAAKKKSNPLVGLIFFILCIVAFVGGLSLKHYKENKSFFVTDFLEQLKGK